MRAVVATRPGGTEALEVIDVDTPEPGPGEVRIRVQAAAVNPVDLQTRQGIYHDLGATTQWPVGLGWDLAGVVDAVGPGVSQPAPGTAVAALFGGVDKRSGAYAQYAVVPAADAIAVPAGLEIVDAASVPLNGTTAVQALDLLGDPDGRRLLVTGAAGGVGGFVAALAVERGYTTIGLARGTDQEFVESTGAQFISELSSDRYDAVVDTAALGESALSTVRDGGWYVGVIPFAVPTAEREITVTAVAVTPNGKVLAGVLDRAVSGTLAVRVQATLPLDRVAEAHKLLEAGGTRGRIILTP